MLHDGDVVHFIDLHSRAHEGWGSACRMAGKRSHGNVSYPTSSTCKNRLPTLGCPMRAHAPMESASLSSGRRGKRSRGGRVLECGWVQQVDPTSLTQPAERSGPGPAREHSGRGPLSMTAKSEARTPVSRGPEVDMPRRSWQGLRFSSRLGAVVALWEGRGEERGGGKYCIYYTWYGVCSEE